MIAAETPRLAVRTTPASAPSQSLLGRLAALLTRAAHCAAETQASDEAVWTSVARGF